MSKQDTQFKKGHVPFNKGLKGRHHSPETEFKEGVLVGETHPSWKGGVQIPVNDCAYLHAGANKRVRRPRVIYEAFHGKIPDGYCVRHKDGDRYNDSIENLEIISRADLLKLNNKTL